MRSHVEVLARAARAVHGTGEIADKLDWVTEEARSATEAAFAAFVGLGDRADFVSASGVPVGEIDRFARPALARLVRPQPGAPAILRSADLALDRRHRRLLQRLELPADASCLAVPVFGGDGMPHGALLLVHPERDRFDLVDEATAIALGEHLGVVFDNLQTIERLAVLQDV